MNASTATISPAVKLEPVDTLACKFPFPVPSDTAGKLEELARLRKLCIDAECEFKVRHARIPARVADAVLAVVHEKRDTFEASLRSAIGWDIQRHYSRPLHALSEADKQARNESVGFLTEDEREYIEFRFVNTDNLLRVWQDKDSRSDAANLLLKYADALKAEVHDVTPRSQRSRDGDHDPVIDYRDVIEAGRQANE